MKTPKLTIEYLQADYEQHLKGLLAELKRLKTMETEISVLVADASYKAGQAEYLLVCMENMLVGGPYERKHPEDRIVDGENDDKGRPIVTVRHKGVEYVGIIGFGSKTVSFPTWVPARVSEIVAEYFRKPVGEMN